MLLDPSISTQPYKNRLAAEQDPLVRRNLELVIEHVQAEIDGDLERIMRTLVPEPVYHVYNITAADGSTINSVVSGVAATRQMYMDALKAGSAQLQELKINFVVADRACVANDAYLRVPWSGAALKALGFDADPEATYLYEGRQCNFWPMHESGLLLGEDMYFDPAGFRDILSRRID